MSPIDVPSRDLIYSRITVNGVSHAWFNNSTLYTLSFVTARIVFLIAGIISAAFCNCSRRNRNRGPCLKYEMTWWHKVLHKYRSDLMNSVAEVVLLKSGELTSERWTPSGKLISSGEENGFGNILNAALAWRFSLWVSSGNSEGEWHVSWFWCVSDFDHYRCPLRFLFLPTSRGKSEAEWVCPDSKS